MKITRNFIELPFVFVANTIIGFTLSDLLFEDHGFIINLCIKCVVTTLVSIILAILYMVIVNLFGKK